MIFRAVNTVLFFALIFVDYDFVHDDINSDFLTRFVDPWLGAFSRLMDGVFPAGFPQEFGAAILILFVLTGNAHKQFARHPVRHPNGRMEV